jgi:outer membrane protein insertion porin family
LETKLGTSSALGEDRRLRVFLGFVGVAAVLGLAAPVAGAAAQTAQTAPSASPTPAPSGTPAPAPAAAPAPVTTPVPPSERIVGIRVVGYQTVSPDTIAHYLGVKVGDPYDPEKIRSNFHTLWDVGLLENLSIEAERAGDGVTLIITVEERPTIKDVEFSGNKKVSTTQIKDKLKELKTEVKVGAPLSLRDVAKTRTSIADIYTENGYRSATVEYRIDDVSKCRHRIQDSGGG